MCPFSVTVQHVPDRELGPLLIQLAQAGFHDPTIEPVGADAVQLKDGDTVLWYWATFGPSGGPPTLLMKRSGRCYSVVAQDDSGKGSVARGAVLHVGDRRAVATRNGRACVGPHLGLLVRATMDGAVRSNALP